MTDNSRSGLSRRQWIGASTLAGLSFGVACAQASQPASASAPAAAIATFPARTQPARVAILLDDGATVIDFTGPWEAFQDASEADVPGFELFTVAPSAAPLRASAGLQIVPDYTLDTAPQPDVVVIGAQGGGRAPNTTTAAKVAWIRSVAANADVVMSVCTGAFLLARTGLIDGLQATTHHDFYDSFAQTFPNVHLVRGRRFVDNGKFMSGGGLTSGVDAALHVVARYYGIDAARRSAAYMEHDGDGWISGVQNLNRPT